MKIVITRDEKGSAPHDSITWASDSDAHSVTELFQQFKGMLVAIGYHPRSVDDCVVDLGAEDWNLYEEERFIENEQG